jgi:4-amino-4-deoxy-L-arabinose transferase-like glycosyltransferase
VPTLRTLARETYARSRGAQARTSRTGLTLAIVVLTLAAFVLRHTGVRAFLPQADERVYATQMRLLRQGDPHPEQTKNFRSYPLLVASLARWSQSAREAEPQTVEEHVMTAGDELAHVRTIVSLLAALAVPAVFALARRFLSDAWSLSAAALYAASPLAIVLGQQARPHAALVAPLLAAVLSCLLVRRRPGIASYALAGLAIGASLAILHSGLAVLPALFVAHALRDRSRARRAGIGLFAALAIAVLIALLAYPGGLPGIEARPDGPAGRSASISGHAVFLDHFNGRGFGTMARAMWDYEPWLGALAVAGFSLWLSRRLRSSDLLGVRGREELIVVAAWCVPYALVVGIYDDSYERFVIPLLPCAAILAASAASIGAKWLTARVGGRSFAAALIAALVLGPQVFLAVRLARAWGARDTLTRCAQWIRANVRPGSARMAIVYTTDVPLLRTSASLRENARQLLDVMQPWLVYQAGLSAEVLSDERYDIVTVPCGGAAGLDLFRSDLPRSMASWRADYVITMVYPPSSRFGVDAVRTRLQENATRVAWFSPYEDEACEEPFWYQQDPRAHGWWTGLLLRSRGFGPVMEVYRVR